MDKVTVVMISNMKFQPITPKMKKAPILGNASPTPLSRNGLKKMKQKAENIPVLSIGTVTLARTRPNVWLFFFNKENTKPATRPATVVLTKQARTVPIGLIGIKMASVDGEKSAIKPLKKPSIAPDRGPYRTAPITMVVNDKLILTGPNCK